MAKKFPKSEAGDGHPNSRSLKDYNEDVQRDPPQDTVKSQRQRENLESSKRKVTMEL